jgi:hypothetical protein
MLRLTKSSHRRTVRSSSGSISPRSSRNVAAAHDEAIPIIEPTAAQKSNFPTLGGKETRQLIDFGIAYLATVVLAFEKHVRRWKTADYREIRERSAPRTVLHHNIDPLSPFMDLVLLSRVDQLREKQEFDGANYKVVVVGGVIVTGGDRWQGSNKRCSNRGFIDGVDFGTAVATLDLREVIPVPREYIRMRAGKLV